MAPSPPSSSGATSSPRTRRSDPDPLDFNDQVDIPSKDFLDLSHLRPAGRAIWQAELARRLAGLYNDGTLRTTL